MLIDDKIVTKEIKKNIENCVEPTSCRIPECFDGNVPPEWSMKVVDDLNN
jgi:hypothetical protein